MITRFDHAVISVPDLDAAMAAYQRLGFEVRPGGRHTGLGTHNALIRFGLDYLELLAPYDDADLAHDTGRGRAMTDYLRNAPAGLLGFALASNRLEDEAARQSVPELGYQVGTPFAMQRARPDGRVLSWRILAPGAHTWRKPWPFLIQWEVDDSERLSWEGIGQHANGVHAVAGLGIATLDVEPVANIYRNQLGLPVIHTDRHARVDLPRCPIELVQSPADVTTEGLQEIRLRVNDLSVTRQWFEMHRIRVEDHSSALVIPVDLAFGARLVLVP
jgi:hypothetical protein